MTSKVAVQTSTAAVVVATFVAWLGFLIHNIADLPGGTGSGDRLYLASHLPLLIVLTRHLRQPTSG